MKISVVIATYNSGFTLEKCLMSVFNQRFLDFEVLVKDGGSEDDTLRILDNYRSKLSFCETGSDNGVYDAWNICLNHCKGDWILFLGSDDYFFSLTFLDEIQVYLEKGFLDNMRIVHGMNQIIDERGQKVAIVGNDTYNNRVQLYDRMPIRHPGCFHHRSLFEDVGQFDSKFRIIGDYQFILRSIKFTDFLFYPFVGVVHRNGGISTNPRYVSNIINENIEMRRDFNMKPFFKVNVETGKRLVILFIVKLFGQYLGKRIVQLFSTIRHFEKFL